jgi:hypothetical protein
MKRVAVALLCSCALGTVDAAGGKGVGNTRKSGPLLGAAPAAAPVPNASGRGGGGAALGAGALAAGLYTHARAVPPLDPKREVSEQDCTQPVDLTRGNLKCK